jgi:hypothetical protein
MISLIADSVDVPNIEPERSEVWRITAVSDEVPFPAAATPVVLSLVDADVPAPEADATRGDV